MTTYYIYDMSGNVLAEADGNKNITKYYIQGQGLLAMITLDDQVYNYHFNAIGSTAAITDHNQNIVNKYAYDVFGNVLNQVETVPQPFKYVGQYGVMAEPNGLYYARARTYDPKVGRWISEDPIGFDGGTVNLYEYVHSNPVNKIDPAGLSDTVIKNLPQPKICHKCDMVGLMACIAARGAEDTFLTCREPDTYMAAAGCLLEGGKGPDCTKLLANLGAACADAIDGCKADYCKEGHVDTSVEGCGECK